MGLGNEVISLSVPTEISVLQDEEITQITASGDVSAAVTARGQVFTWGRTKNVVFGADVNLENDAGISLSPTTNLVLPTPLEAEGIVFTKVACGKTHVVGITNSGRLISWGNPDQGKLVHRKKVLTEEEKKLHLFTLLRLF